MTRAQPQCWGGCDMAKHITVKKIEAYAMEYLDKANSFSSDHTASRLYLDIADAMGMLLNRHGFYAEYSRVNERHMRVAQAVKSIHEPSQ